MLRSIIDTIDVESILPDLYKVNDGIVWTKSTQGKQTGLQYKIGDDPWTSSVGRQRDDEMQYTAINPYFKDTIFETLIEKYNLTADDLGLTAGKGAKAKGKAGASVKVVKYRNPANPNETYGGKGPKPAWLKEKLEQGAKMADFAA